MKFKKQMMQCHNARQPQFTFHKNREAATLKHGGHSVTLGGEWVDGGWSWGNKTQKAKCTVKIHIRKYS